MILKDKFKKILDFKKGKNDSLKTLNWRINRTCNAQCIMCERWHRKEYILSTKKMMDILKKAKEAKVKQVRLIGGEPTLRTDLVRIIQEAREFGMKVHLTTNGSTLGPDYIEQLNKSGLNSFTISIDSASKGIHDSIRGFPGLLKQITGGINYYKQIRPKKFIFANTVVMNKNYKNIGSMVNLAKKLDLWCITFTQLSSTEKFKSIALTKKQLKEFYFKIIPEIIRKLNNSGILIKFSPFFVDLIGKSNGYIIDQLENHPEKFEEEINLFSEEKYGTKFYSQYDCYVVKEELQILENGDVYPCCSLHSDPEMKMGNVLNQSIVDIWNSEKYRNFRHDSKKPKHERCLKCEDSFYYNHERSKFRYSIKNKSSIIRLFIKKHCSY